MFRNTVEAITLIPELQGLGVATHIMDLGGVSLDTSTPMGGFFLTVAAGFAELERKQIAERTRNALRHKRDQGKQYSAVPPYGWRYDAGKMLEVSNEQQVLRLICGQLDDGATLREICNALMCVGIVTRTGKRTWHPSTIGKIIKHPLVQRKFEQWRGHAAESDLLHGDTSTGDDDGGTRVHLH